jgi:hypothetical protein
MAETRGFEGLISMGTWIAPYWEGTRFMAFFL